MGKVESAVAIYHSNKLPVDFWTLFMTGLRTSHGLLVTEDIQS